MTARAASRSPRLLVKVLCFAFAVIGCVIVAVFLLFSWQTNARLTRSVVENMGRASSALPASMPG